jgi:hypothetical protein
VQNDAPVNLRNLGPFMSTRPLTHTPKYLEWDYDNPKHRQRRRRPPPPLDGEVLEPEEPSPRIRVEVHHRIVPRQRQHVPPWLVALLIIAVVMWISTFGAVVALVMISIFVTAHPTIAIALGGMVTLVAIAALRERRAGRPF